LPTGRVLTLPLTRNQKEKKRLAILSHESQVKLRPRELPACAERAERFIWAGDAPEKINYYHPLRKASCNADTLNLKLFTTACIGAFGSRTLYLAANQRGKAYARLKLPIPFYSKGIMIDMIDTMRGLKTGQAWFCGSPRMAEIKVPLSAFMPADQVFVKIKRRYGFFDEAGWREIPIHINP